MKTGNRLRPLRNPPKALRGARIEKRHAHQMGFADALFVDAMASRENRSNRTACFLEKLCGVVDFTPIEAALCEACTATRGRDPHDPLVMFKMTLLQHFYALSDPECEAQVADRRSFREFCGLGLADRVPDETALVRFRARLVARGLHTRLLGLVNAQLEARGLMVKAVMLVDATIVESARRKLERAERAEGAQGDPEAGCATKGGRVYYGFKAHVAADEAHTLIRAAELTVANMHDSRKFKDVRPADSEIALADKAYAAPSTRHGWPRAASTAPPQPPTERGAAGGQPPDGRRARRHRENLRPLATRARPAADALRGSAQEHPRTPAQERGLEPPPPGEPLRRRKARRPKPQGALAGQKTAASTPCRTASGTRPPPSAHPFTPCLALMPSHHPQTSLFAEVSDYILESK